MQYKVCCMVLAGMVSPLYTVYLCHERPPVLKDHLWSLLGLVCLVVATRSKVRPVLNDHVLEKQKWSYTMGKKIQFRTDFPVQSDFHNDFTWPPALWNPYVKIARCGIQYILYLPRTWFLILNNWGELCRGWPRKGELVCVTFPGTICHNSETGSK